MRCRSGQVWAGVAIAQRPQRPLWVSQNRRRFFLPGKQAPLFPRVASQAACERRVPPAKAGGIFSVSAARITALLSARAARGYFNGKHDENGKEEPGGHQ